MTVRPVILFWVECWTLKRTREQKMSCKNKNVKMDVRTYEDGKNKKWKYYRESQVAPIKRKLCEIRLKWCGHVLRQLKNCSVRQCEIIINIHIN